MKRILAVVLTSILLVSSSITVCATEPTGSTSVTAEAGRTKTDGGRDQDVVNETIVNKNLVLS